LGLPSLVCLSWLGHLFFWLRLFQTRHQQPIFCRGLRPHRHGRYQHDGRLNANAPNAFNDVRLVFWVDNRGSLRAKPWEATSEPGRFWTLNPMDDRGAARIAFGQYKAWRVGSHRAGTLSAHEALVQVDPLRVYRDLNKDDLRQGERSTKASSVSISIGATIMINWIWEIEHGLPGRKEHRRPSSTHEITQGRSTLYSERWISLYDHDHGWKGSSGLN